MRQLSRIAWGLLPRESLLAAQIFHAQLLQIFAVFSFVDLPNFFLHHLSSFLFCLQASLAKHNPNPLFLVAGDNGMALSLPASPGSHRHLGRDTVASRRADPEPTCHGRNLSSRPM